MEQLKFYAKMASASLLRWLLISGSGLLLCIVGFLVGLHLLDNNAGSDWYATAGQEPLSAGLLLASLILPAIYFVLANKITLGFVLYGLLDNKLLPLIGDKVASLVSAFTQQGGFAKLLGNASTLRDKLVTLAGEDSTLNKIQRKAVRYGLAQIRLDDIDFRQPDLDLPGVISGRLVEALQAAAEPGYQLFWIVATSHVTLLIVALLFDHT